MSNVNYHRVWMPYHQHPYGVDKRMVFALEHVNAQILALIRLNVRRLFRFDIFFCFCFRFEYFGRGNVSTTRKKSAKTFWFSNNRNKKQDKKTTINKFEHNWRETLQLVYTTIPRKMKLPNSLFRFGFSWTFSSWLLLVRFGTIPFKCKQKWSFNRLSLRFDSRSIVYLHLCVCVLLGLFDIKFNGHNSQTTFST